MMFRLMRFTRVPAVCLLCQPLCFVAAQINPARSVELPLEFRHGNLLVRARINGSEPLTFKLDTGFGITTIHPDLVETLKLQRNGHTTIIGIAGKEEAPTYGGAVFDFGGVTYSPRRIASLPSDAGRRHRGRDGILGAGLFRRFVVEIDTSAKTMRLHDPNRFVYEGKGEIIPLEFQKDTPIIEASIASTGKASVTARFEIDTGCDDYLCLGHEFVETNHLVDAGSSKGSFRTGVGGDVRIRSGELAQLQIGKLTVDKPAANFFLQSSPVDEGLAGHIGMGVLQKFKVIFDYSRKQMILEPKI